MSLNEQQRAAVHLGTDVVRGRADFFASYARTEEPLFDPSAYIRALRDGPIATGEGAVVSLFSEDDGGPVAEFRRRVDEIGQGPRYPNWVRVAERADALRQSAMAELLYDTEAGRQTLLRSAQEYRRLGLPFGLFLETAATGSWDNAFAAARLLRQILNPVEAARPPDDDSLLPLGQVLAAPAQQVALLLSAMSHLDVVYDYRAIGEDLATAAQAQGSAPVGTTAQPIALWWECGRRLVDVARERDGAPRQLRRLVAELASAHGSQLRNAQYDTFHWPRAAARVDLVDLDLAGLVAISTRLLRQIRGPLWSIIEDFGNLSPLAQVSIQVGLDLAGDRGDPSGADEPGPLPEPLYPHGEQPGPGQSGMGA